MKWQPRKFVVGSLWWRLAILATALTAVVKGQRYNVQDFDLVQQRRDQMTRVADDCVSQLGTSLGEEFLECLMTGLQQRGEFPMPSSYQLHPLTIQQDDRHQHGLMLLDLLRNYTCGRTQDGGSKPVAVESWTYDEQQNAQQITKQQQMTCPSNLDDMDDTTEEDALVGKTGYLPDGDHLTERKMTVEQAKVYCERWSECQGFTFELSRSRYSGSYSERGKHSMFFKSKANKGVIRHKQWKSYIRTSNTIPKHCRRLQQQQKEQNGLDQEGKRQYDPPQQYRVEIIRREPLVVKIPSFASPQECQQLQTAGGTDEEMGRAHETGQGPTSYRRSYSADINVDYENQEAPLTKFAEKMFSFVRNVTHYQVYGPGQEPINAVLYKNAGDEYRPHCDGLCQGQQYPYGERVATSILYCHVPASRKLGGQTSFTRSGLMIAPNAGDLLLFAYKYANGTMDNGFTEHSGCKIHEGGRKWIATQWYREGVDYDQPWSIMYD